jgi:hypothetical protein
MGKVEEEVSTKVPEVSGLCLAPDGQGLLAASDENGVYYVTLAGDTRPFYTERRMDCEGVTLDPETRDVYYIVERKQEVRRLKGPDYNESELLCTIDEVGKGTNSGLEGISWYKDGKLFIGNQMHPTVLFQYSLTDGIISRTEITGTTEIAALCYDPDRDVLWIADSEQHNINLCTTDGDVLMTYPVPFIDNGESLYVDHVNDCIWVGDDTTSKIYKISFYGL